MRTFNHETLGRSLKGKPLEEILQELGIKPYKTNLLKWSKEDLLKEFGRGIKPKNINKSLFIKNVIWQTYQAIQAGENPFDIGNIRSFWYYIKDTMDRIGATKKGDAYNAVEIALQVQAVDDPNYITNNQGYRAFASKIRLKACTP